MASRRLVSLDFGDTHAACMCLFSPSREMAYATVVSLRTSSTRSGFLVLVLVCEIQHGPTRGRVPMTKAQIPRRATLWRGRIACSRTAEPWLDRAAEAGHLRVGRCLPSIEYRWEIGFEGEIELGNLGNRSA